MKETLVRASPPPAAPARFAVFPRSKRNRPIDMADCASPADEYRTVLTDFETIRDEVSKSYNNLEHDVRTFQQCLEEMLARLVETDDTYRKYRKHLKTPDTLMRSMQEANHALKVERNAFEQLVNTMQETSSLLDHFRRSSQKVRGLHQEASKYLKHLSNHLSGGGSRGARVR
jgi:DNA repair ATPase RecN